MRNQQLTSNEKAKVAEEKRKKLEEEKRMKKLEMFEYHGNGQKPVRT